MIDYNVNVFSIESILPLHLVGYYKGIYEINDVLKEKEERIIENFSNVNVANEVDPKVDINREDIVLGNKDFTPDVNLGNLAEEYIEKLVLNQKKIDNTILEVERVAITKKDKPLGYDIEVTMINKSKIGIEVKATRLKDGNIIHLTNNEIRASLKLNEKYYLIIVVYDNTRNEVVALYRIKHFSETMGIGNEKLQDLVSTKSLNNIQFYPQVFIINIPPKTLKWFNIEVDEERIIKEQE